MRYVKKIIDVLKEDGIVILFRKIIRRIKFITLSYFDYWFDLKHGVDTCGVIFPDNNPDIGNDMIETVHRYEASPVKAVCSILKKIPIDHSTYTFIDYGSGKGRVLLLASEYSFKNIIGVELSRRLHETAEKNLKIHKRLNQKCAQIKSVCVDAVEFKLPNDPLLIFFFTPFQGNVMERVVENIQRSLDAFPRSVHIAWYGQRMDVMKLFSEMKNFTHQEIFSERLLSASGDYKGHLFSFNPTQ